MLILSKKLKKNKRKILLVIALVFVAVSILSPSLAHAALFNPTDTATTNLGGAKISYTCNGNIFTAGGCILINIAKLFFLIISYGVGLLFTELLQIAAYALDLMFVLGQNLTNLPFVRRGFELTLGLTNILFVVAIIFIAFMTMLRIGQGLKDSLKKLIIAALLVNFSFLIAGTILDASNVMADQFIQHINATNIGSAIQPQEAISVMGAKSQAGVFDLTAKGSALLNFVLIWAGISMWAFLTFLLLVAVSVITVTILVRNIWIAFLLVLMPLTWPLYILPGMKKYSKMWWDNFIKWTIYLPIATFFVWLALATMKAMAIYQGGSTRLSQSFEVPFTLAKEASSGVVDIQGLVFLFFNNLLILAFFYGAVKMANASSTIGGAIGVQMASKLSEKVRGGTNYAGKKVFGLGKRVSGIQATQDAGKSAGRGAAKIASHTFSGIARRTPFGIGRRSLTEGANVFAGMADASNEIAKLQKSLFSNQTDSKMLQMLHTGTVPRGDKENAAFMAEMAKRKLGKKIDIPKGDDAASTKKRTKIENYIKKLFDATARAYNVESAADAPAGDGVPGTKDMITAHPRLAAIATLTEEEMKDQVKVDEAITKHASTFSGADALSVKIWDLPTILGVSDGALKHVIERGTKETVGEIKTLLTNKLTGISTSSGPLLARMDALESKLSLANDMLSAAKKSGNATRIKDAQNEKDDTTEEIKTILKENNTGELWNKYSVLKRAKVGEFTDLET